MMMGGDQSMNQNNQNDAKEVTRFDTEHEGIINDCQFDFYGVRMASCDSNGFVSVFNVD
jgi:cysteine sulfinate desulfinase/cysteine desulfurase-like protein